MSDRVRIGYVGVYHFELINSLAQILISRLYHSWGAL